MGAIFYSSDLSLAKRLKSIGTFDRNFIAPILWCLCRLEGVGEGVGVDRNYLGGGSGFARMSPHLRIEMWGTRASVLLGSPETILMGVGFALGANVPTHAMRPHE
jgi:hypothetical protein